jgi:formylglycine-generating enzyme required for sulfatase activity
VRIGTIALAGSLAACALEPEQLPPLGEVAIRVDTDLDPTRFIARLKIDLYDEQERWFYSREYARDEAGGWPTSFVLVGDDPADPAATTKRVLVRLRLYPSNKVRDYRGERYFPPGSASAECRDPLYPGGLDPYLAALDRIFKPLYELDGNGDFIPALDAQGEPIVVDGEPQFLTKVVLDEPLPELTIDRMVPVELVPGELGQIEVVLRGACLGVPASFGESLEPGDEITCLDADAPLEPVGLSEIEPVSVAATPSSIGQFPGALACLAETDPGGLQSFEDEVCLDGGLFVLGDPAVFGFGLLDPNPEHAAVVKPFVMDRYEVSVGRFREALRAGLLGDAQPPDLNDGPLVFDGERIQACTFTSEGRDKYPINCIPWETARAFCRAFGGDLPTEAQWEYAAAASGRDGRETRFPWGSEEPTCARAIYGRAPTPAVGATNCAVDSPDVGVHPLQENVQSNGDRTPTGIVGMGGSLSEFVLDAPIRYCAECWYASPLDDRRCPPFVSERLVRGGNWASDDDSLLAGLRVRVDDSTVLSSRVGFRCVRPGAGP